MHALPILGAIAIYDTFERVLFRISAGLKSCLFGWFPFPPVWLFFAVWLPLYRFFSSGVIAGGRLLGAMRCCFVLGLGGGCRFPFLSVRLPADGRPCRHRRVPD